MSGKNYTVSFTVDAKPIEVFKKINDVKKWWTENLEGNSQKLNDEFTVQFDDVHMSKQKLVEFLPDERVVWLVTESQLNFIKDRQEWNGTKIIFEISERENKTEVRFTHQGLVPAIECFDACSNAWGEYIQQSLYELIKTGKGHPTPKAEPQKA